MRQKGELVIYLCVLPDPPTGFDERLLETWKKFMNLGYFRSDIIVVGINLTIT